MHNFHITIILGRDWLQQNWVRIYFYLGDEYVALKEVRYVSSIARRARQVTLKLQFMPKCITKVGLRDDKLKNSYKVEQLKSGFVSNLCGVPIESAIVTVGTTVRRSEY